jgi:hypothetical protein
LRRRVVFILFQFLSSFFFQFKNISMAKEKAKTFPSVEISQREVLSALQAEITMSGSFSSTTMMMNYDLFHSLSLSPASFTPFICLARV